MKKPLFLALLLAAGATTAHAQTKSAVQGEHETLIKKRAALAATLAKRSQAVATGPQGEQLLVEVLSCTADKRSQMATLRFSVLDMHNLSKGGGSAPVQEREAAAMTCNVSLKGFPAQAPTLKKLNFEFLHEMGAGRPDGKFSVSLTDVPIVWQ